MQTLGELYFVPDHVLGTGNALGDTADGAVASVAFVVNSRCGGIKKPVVVLRALRGDDRMTAPCLVLTVSSGGGRL